MDETMNDDLILLREYARRDSGEAFAALVSRHVNLVWNGINQALVPLGFELVLGRESIAMLVVEKAE
jgi:hypothetical protein